MGTDTEVVDCWCSTGLQEAARALDVLEAEAVVAVHQRYYCLTFSKLRVMLQKKMEEVASS